MKDLNATIAQMDDAINRDDMGEVMRLLASGLDPNLRDAGGDHFLTSAAWIGSPLLVEVLLEAGADPTLKGADGKTPLERLLQNTEYWDEGHDKVRRLLETWDQQSRASS